jgi:2-dehydro-3-deoxyphosphogluconate aldolase/(4S)-4-hydroxy-2-oxoglutarate aldolase
MDATAVLQRLTEVGIVPVVRSDAANRVAPAVRALMDGGIPVAEITMTVPEAATVIQNCVRDFEGGAIIGAGSITNASDCKRVIDAGCRFVVTPTVSTDVIAVCKSANICVIGGALTPTEILTVWNSGAEAVKVFPIKAVGGAAYVNMIHEPLPQIPLVPTGGVGIDTISDYMSAGAAFVGAGGDLAGKALVNAGQTDEIAQRARRYVEAIRKSRSSSAPD